ncbi:MAG: PQQ-dependent sugar dehydrogenase [Gammaproteobacteria bacterium]|nr:PQQ-dependent sugar dehydrogenase [Gammaproteobacteria bacterium]
MRNAKARLSAHVVAAAALSIVATSAPGAGRVWEDADHGIRAVLVADGLVWPWDIAFLPDGDAMLVTEAPGRLRIVRDGAVAPSPAWTSPSPRSDDVLHGVVLHPRFAENGWVYVSYARSGWRGITLAIARGRLRNDRLVGVREIFVADAWADALHNIAGRMAFGPDGALYVSIGDRDRLWVTDNDELRMRAQRLDDHVGKVLRLTEDGGVPKDNPFVGRRGVKPEIFAYGFRNGYGLAFHPETAELWQADIGPRGGDEINVVVPGGNYGWPLVSAGTRYSGTAIGAGAGTLPEARMPSIWWVPAITPSSIAFYTADELPDWSGNLLVSALSGKQLQRIVFGEDGTERLREPLLEDLGLRFRVVTQGPDGYLYAATEKRYGGGDADGAILRIEPY